MNFNDLHKLHYFKEAAETLNYTKTAQNLGASPSGVQQAVKSLEESIGHKLFIRKSKGLALTPEGKLLYGRTLNIMKELSLAEKELTSKIHEPISKLKILTTLGLAADLVCKYLPIIKSIYPDLKFELRTSNLELSLETEEYDIYVGPKTESAKNYKSMLLTNIDFKLYASPSYIDKFGNPSTLKDLQNHKLINFSGTIQSYFTHTNKNFSQLEEYENYDFTIDFYLVEYFLVNEGLGIASLATAIVKLRYPHFVNILPKTKPISVPIYMYYLPRKLEDKFIKESYDAFIKALPLNS